MRAKEFTSVLSELKLALVAVPILAMIFSAVISLYVLSPVYKASTTLMVFNQPTASSPYEVRVGTIMLNQRLVRTYCELAKSTMIFEEVIKQNNLKMSVDDLRKRVNIELLGETEFLRITVNSTNPTLSAMLANEVARVLLEKVAELMVLDNIQIIDPASPPNTPVWPNHNLNILLAGAVGLLLIVGVALFRASIRAEDGEQDRPINNATGQSGSND
ncbi:Capsular polysaccharide biosynthesis protein [Desulfotomaculum arcticum]|uniref:Capsular polysaccharide biosynthesis protein n=1 Tax=Desulfotruncus arcticus DSM 17038 TaxID=1121424 RepID=A0A1I2VM86_9FIRM|nr:Wzz/FepE/Etk N-terminal domain-containing protein [Desulfotruncus arcticus]SFG89529.1 Capsular polysaccharide biosynthesis protein [Desulfotomaculum arcticum] [Desulfotruncus arcticus DSM 17038]